MWEEEREYQEYEERHLSRGAVIARRCFSILWKILVFGIIAIVLWRVLFSVRVPSGMKDLSINDAVYTAYRENGNDLILQTQDIDPISMDKEVGGYFWVCEAVYLPQAEQLQILIRYNNSTLENIAERFGLEKTPDRDETVVDVTLVITTDDSTDEQTTIRIQPSAQPTADKTIMYNYRRYVFDGVTFDPTTLVNLSVDFYYIEEVNYYDKPLSTIIAYNPALEVNTVPLSARDRRALEQWEKG